MTRLLLISVAALALAGQAMAADPPPTPGEIAMFQEGGQYVLRSANDSLALYTYDRDAPGKSNCNAACAAAWPPVLAEAGARPLGPWTPVKRDDGALQWAYQGKPIYTFGKDAPGKPTGDGMGGVWRLLPPIPAGR